MSIPVRIPLNREDAAEEALARFRTQWPAERCQRLAKLVDGDPAETAKVWAEALSRPAETPADDVARVLLSDDEMLGLAKGHRKFNRENRL